MDIVVRVVYYGAVFAVSYYAGKKLGQWLAEKDREHRIASFHQTNAIRANVGLEPLGPSGFGLWGYEVDPKQAHLRPTGDA